MNEMEIFHKLIHDFKTEILRNEEKQNGDYVCDFKIEGINVSIESIYFLENYCIFYEVNADYANKLLKLLVSKGYYPSFIEAVHDDEVDGGSLLISFKIEDI